MIYDLVHTLENPELLSFLEGLEPAAPQCMTQYRYCTILGVISKGQAVRHGWGPSRCQSGRASACPMGLLP